MKHELVYFFSDDCGSSYSMVPLIFFISGLIVLFLIMFSSSIRTRIPFRMRKSTTSMVVLITLISGILNLVLLISNVYRKDVSQDKFESNNFLTVRGYVKKHVKYEKRKNLYVEEFVVANVNFLLKSNNNYYCGYQPNKEKVIYEGDSICISYFENGEQKIILKISKYK